MYRKLVSNTLVVELLGSLILSSFFVMTLFTYIEHKGIGGRLYTYFSSQSDIEEEIDDRYSQDVREKLLRTVTMEHANLGKIARQVALLSFISVPSIPLETIAIVAHTTMMMRKQQQKQPTKVNYAKLQRYSPLHKAYHYNALQEYALVESYLLYTLEKGVSNPLGHINVFAMRSYILKVNPRLGFQYADTVAKKIIEVAHKYNLPFILLGGLIGTESTYNKRAVSDVGAAGLTQVYPKVWKKALIQKGLIQSIHDLYTIEKNIEAGAYILNSYYTLGKEMKHTNPLRYALHRYYGARDNSYVERVYKHSQRIAQQISLLG